MSANRIDQFTEREAKHLLNDIASLFLIGGKARTPTTILENIKNARRRSDCLSRIENHLTIQIEEDGELIDDPLLSWGDEPDEYIKNFKMIIDNVVEWNRPDKIPDVAKGEEQPYWIAIKNDKGKIYVFMALYQNRPLELDEHGDPLNDSVLVDPDGEPINSVGWVEAKKHAEFDDFWELIHFNKNYKLLGWAEYVPPTFNI